jgi:glycosyltransferase involved in cell wall biosynthesis
MVSTFYPPYSFGGDAVYVHRLSQELARRGHEIDVVHCADAYRILQRGPVAAAPPGHPNIRVHTLRGRAGALSPLLTQQTGRAILKAGAIRDLVDRGRYDVIHYHNLSLIGLDVTRFGEAVKLYTTHEHWLVCPMHVLWRNNREACRKRTCFTCQLVSGRPPQWWRYTTLADRELSRIDRFLCPSRFTLGKHRELGFRRPMTHLPYFLRRAAHSRVAAPPHSRPYVLFVGRLEKIKGVQDLIRAFRSYRHCDLAIIGDGTYERDLRRQADGLQHVHFLGRLPFEAMAAWYQHAVAVVVPSICFEVFGIVILEGFTMSTPALVTPFGALPEVIEDSGGGLVYRDDGELIDAVDRLRLNRPLRDELGRRGFEAYVRLWSEDPHIEGYMRIIQEARGSGRALRGADPLAIGVNG